MLIKLAHVRTCCCSTKSGVNYNGWKCNVDVGKVGGGGVFQDYKIYRFECTNIMTNNLW